MPDAINEQEVLNQITHWAKDRPDIRAVLLTSSRARPGAATDAFSDFDVILVAEDIRPYLEDESWLGDFGKVLVLYRDPVKSEYGFERFIRVTQYENGLKIDFTLWPVGLLQSVAGMPELPDYLDDGYRVLLDKDGLTQGMKAPSRRAFVPRPPTEDEYRIFVEEFFSNAPYVAKHIRRGDLFPLKALLDFMRNEKLRRMLEWRVEIDHDWSLKTGAYGKGLARHLSPEIIKELEGTCVGFEAEANWEALFRLIKLFRKVTQEVGRRLGYAYPSEIDSRVLKYLYKIKDMR
jgi:aminoglycoside 6-adenylyltransferase